MFDERIKRQYENFRAEMVEIEKYYEKYAVRYVKKTKPQTPRPQRAIGHNGFHYIQSVLYRSNALFEGFITSINSENALMAFLVTRAHFEVTGAISYFLKRLNSYYSKNISYQQLEMDIKRLWLGTRDSNIIEKNENVPEPISVMTLIDAADDIYRKKSSNKDKIYRNSYDDLCEYCHPNFWGVTMGSHINKISIARFDKHPVLDKEHLFIFFDMNITLKTFISNYDEVLDILSKNEEMPIIYK